MAVDVNMAVWVRFRENIFSSSFNLLQIPNFLAVWYRVYFNSSRYRVFD
jgi:hypothetical protein